MLNIEKVIFDTVDDIDCRILITDVEPFVCVSDLYNQLTIHRNTLMTIIDTNKDSFSGYLIRVNGNDLQFNDSIPHRGIRQGGFQKNTEYNFINEDGYNLLIQKINPSTIKDDEKREMVINRQRGMAELFTKYRKKEIVSVKSVQSTIHPSMRSPEQVCKDKIDLGNYIADLFQVPRQMATTVAIAEAQRETGVDFFTYQKLIPPVNGTYEEPKIGAQELGKPYGDNGRKVNLLLQQLGYIYKNNGKWQLTDQGEKSGGAWFTYTLQNGHTDTHIRWPTTMKHTVEDNKHLL